MTLDGIEALRAIKEGKTVLRYRHTDQTPDRTDAYYRFDFKYTTDEDETSKKIWTRFRDEKYWHECENPARFWIVSDGFVIIEESTEGTEASQ